MDEHCNDEVLKDPNKIFENFMKGSILEEEKRFLKRIKKGEKLGDIRKYAPGSEDEFRLYFDILAHFLVLEFYIILPAFQITS